MLRARPSPLMSARHTRASAMCVGKNSLSWAPRNTKRGILGTQQVAELALRYATAPEGIPADAHVE